MRAKMSWSYKLSLAAVVFGLVAISSILITAQTVGPRRIGAPVGGSLGTSEPTAPGRRVGQPVGVSFPIAAPPVSPYHVGMVEDWSFHRLLFSNPGTLEQVRNDPAAYSRWINIQYDTRYIMQQMKRSGGAQPLVGAGTGGVNPPGGPVTPGGPHGPVTVGGTAKPPKGTGFNGLWAQNLLAGSVMPNTYPAKYNFDTTGTPDCTNDYAVFPTGTRSSTTAATIVAYRNLYVTTCTPTAPTIYWAYNTGGTTYSVTTSPVISVDGTKVAFIQTTASAAQLVVLKFAASGGTVAVPASAPTTSSTGMNCTAPCMTVTTITGATTGDIYSSPFYDYTADALYVGDNASHLYKITGGVFKGTGALTVASVTLNATAYNVGSPVYDHISGCVFVGDSQGYLYSVSSGVAGGVCNGSSYALWGHSAILANGSANAGIFDAPLVDSTAGMVYAFVAGSAAITNCASGNNCVYQFTTSKITSGSTTAAPSNEEPLGTGGASANLYAGAFDNTYFTSSSASSPSGNIYVGGDTGLTGGGGALYRVPISSNALLTPVSAVTVNASRAPFPTPVTEFFNANDIITATGTLTVVGTVATGWAGSNFVVGGTTYTFVTGAPTAANQVQLYTGGTTTANRNATAENMEAVILAVVGDCYSGTTSCVWTGANPQTANASATTTHTTATNVVTLTSKTVGSAGNFTLTSSNSSNVAASGGSGGADGTDFIFFGVYRSSVGGNCTNGNKNGCVLAYNVNTTTPSLVGSINTSATGGSGGLPGCWSTSGFVIDNYSASAGASQVYFINMAGNSPSTTPSTCTAGTGNTIMAEQASQSALQ